MIFEFFFDENIHEFSQYQLMKDTGIGLSEVEIHNWCFQIFQVVAYVHHDLKPGIHCILCLMFM